MIELEGLKTRASQRLTRASKGRRIGRYLVLTFAALLTAFPFYVMFVLALGPPGPITLPDALLPTDLTLANFKSMAAGTRTIRWLVNTLIYSLVSVVLVLLFASMAAYAFAKKRFTGKNAIFWGMLAMLMVPYHVTLIPLFIVVSRLGWVNSYWGLIIPTVANVQALFLMRQFIAGIPDDLLDAAKLDGASELRIFWNVVIPLSKPILITLGVFVFLWHWNDFLWPLIIAQQDAMRTLTVGLASLQQQQVSIREVMAGSVITFLPVFFIFLYFQRYFVRGAMMSGLK